jgi:hypothetical protein
VGRFPAGAGRGRGTAGASPGWCSRRRSWRSSRFLAIGYWQQVNAGGAQRHHRDRRACSAFLLGALAVTVAAGDRHVGRVVAALLLRLKPG